MTAADPKAPARSLRDPGSHRCLIRLRGVYPSLKSAEKKAADFILRAGDRVRHLSIVEFASEAGCSEATATRLSRKLGYGGFPALKQDVGRPDEAVPYPDLLRDDPAEVVARKIFDSTIQALRDTAQVIDPAQYRAAAAALLQAERVAFFGLGNAAVVAREAYQKFLRIGVPSYTAEDSDLQLIMVNAQLSAGDVLVAVSYSGESRPILAAAQQARARRVRVIALTNYPRSSLARMAEVVLLTAVFQEHVNGEIASKRIAQLCVLESLYVHYLLQRRPQVRDRLRASNRAVAVNKRRAPVTPRTESNPTERP